MTNEFLNTVHHLYSVIYHAWAAVAVILAGCAIYRWINRKGSGMVIYFA